MEPLDALELIERCSVVLEHLIVESYDLRVAVDAHERSIDAARSNLFYATDALKRERRERDGLNAR
jgi:hypothetical protein